MRLEVIIGEENPGVLVALRVLADLLIRLDKSADMSLHGGGDAS